jgi:phosphonate transport system substrate-binding protein
VPAESPAEVVEKHRLEIGIAPYLPVRILVRSYQPLRAHLEHELGEPVEIVTAPDYRSFHQRIDHREYPLVITVVNSAYLAYRDVGYVPMLQPLHATYPILVTLQSSAAHGLAELRGKSLALPDPLAVISMQALSLIGEAGLHAGRDIHLRHMPTHSAAVNHVLTGEVAAAIVSNRALQQMSQDVRGRVRVAQSWEQHAVPGIVYLASPRLSHERRTRLIDAIVAFTHSPKGRAMMQTFGYGELVPASARDLEAFAAYGSMLKAALAAPAGDASPAHPPP